MTLSLAHVVSQAHATEEPSYRSAAFNPKKNMSLQERSTLALDLHSISIPCNWLNNAERDSAVMEELTAKQTRSTTIYTHERQQCSRAKISLPRHVLS